MRLLFSEMMGGLSSIVILIRLRNYDTAQADKADKVGKGHEPVHDIRYSPDNFKF